jgi:hypothetical protein
VNEEKYFERFFDKEGIEYGLRLGIPGDAEEISKMFIEAYEYNYIYKMVYEPSELRENLSDPNNFWLVGESIESGEIFGAGLMQKRNVTIYIGKMVIKQKFQKKGLARELGSRGIMTCLNKSIFKDTYKLLTEVRTGEVNAQKMMDRIGIPYAFIPEFINFGDRRHFDFTKGEPFVGGDKESAILYFIPFERLWQYREPKIFLPNRDEILYFYNFIKSYNKKTARMMKNDTIIFETSKDDVIINFEIKEDLSIGFISLIGLINEDRLIKLLQKYAGWRIIQWEIPLSYSSTSVVELALNKGFNILGYNIGAYFDPMNQRLLDSIVLGIFPRGINKSFEKIKIVERAKPLVEQIINTLR